MSTREPGLLESSTLAEEIGATAAATAPFVTSSVTPTPEREGGGPGDYVTGPNLRSQLASERFVILTDSSHHSGSQIVVTSIVFHATSPFIDCGCCHYCCRRFYLCSDS
ncbi:hypothetical protein Tco_1083040 [Tanacetum coccineum]|uniref:Uncharacterized protein n=1 Tax=Tanacetum coccineum TaxID=301880 RepID=A0ABQ5I291_9ASTR